MQFKIEKDIFLKGLAKIQSVVEKRHTIPILSNVLISTEENGICLTATDLEVGLQTNYTATVLNPGKVTVSAKKLFEIIKELPDEIISFKAKENCWIEIKCGKSLFNVVGLSYEEFPPFPKIDKSSSIEIEASVLREMIDKTFFSISTDETKFNLNGIFFKHQQENDNSYLLMVATDGHRLSMIKKGVSVENKTALDEGVILPRKGINELKKLTDEGEGVITLAFTENNAIAMKDKTIVVMRLVDGEFPDYTRVIPNDVSQSSFIDRNSFLHALRRISVLSNEKSRGVKFNFSGTKLELSSSQAEVGEASEELDIQFNGQDISIGFNAKYIIDILQALDTEQIEFSLRDNVSPGMVRTSGAEGFLAVVMPMRL